MNMTKGKAVKTLALMTGLMMVLSAASGCGIVKIQFGKPTAGTMATTKTTTKATTRPTAGTTTAVPSPSTTSKATTAAPAATSAAPLPKQAGMYGNTSGNLSNGGFAAYDAMTASHLLGGEGALLRYDPATGKTVTVVAVKGRPTHINVSTLYYYFIQSQDGAFYRVGRDGKGLLKMADGTCTFAGRVNHYVQVLQNGQLALLYDNEDGGSKPISSGSGVMEASLGSNRVYYISSAGDYRVSANTGMGRTTVYSGQAFDAPHHLFAIKEDLFAYVDRQGTGETIFTLESLKEPVPMPGAVALPSISSLNYSSAGTVFYYIGKSDGAFRLYSMVSGKTPVEIARVDGTDPRVCVVNDWFYVLDSATNTLVRLHPSTGVKENV